MYSWLGFSQDKLNDVVLTPSYVATLLVKLARVNKDSFVWDFATGSAGLLVATMNEMLIDAKDKIKSPDEFASKATNKNKGKAITCSRNIVKCLYACNSEYDFDGRWKLKYLKYRLVKGF